MVEVDPHGHRTSCTVISLANTNNGPVILKRLVKNNNRVRIDF